MTATVIGIRRASGKGRQPAAIEALMDATDELHAHTREALEFVDRSTPKARQLELALEAIVTDDPHRDPLWRHLHQLAAAVVYELERYERRHLPMEPEPLAVVA